MIHSLINCQDIKRRMIFVYQVVPPAEWKPRRGGYDDIGSMEISTPISQFVNGQQGVYQLYNIQKKPISVTEYIEMANSDKLVCLCGSSPMLVF